MALHVHIRMYMHAYVCMFVSTYSTYHLAGYFPLGARISQMSSLLGKIYSELLHEVPLWAAIAEIGTDAVMSRWAINI